MLDIGSKQKCLQLRFISLIRTEYLEYARARLVYVWLGKNRLRGLNFFRRYSFGKNHSWNVLKVQTCKVNLQWFVCPTFLGGVEFARDLRGSVLVHEIKFYIVTACKSCQPIKWSRRPDHLSKISPITVLEPSVNTILGKNKSNWCSNARWIKRRILTQTFVVTILW